MRGRKLRRHIAWRVDADYKAQLAPEDAAWLDQFEREYYEADFRGDNVHPRELRRDCYRRSYAARTDAPTACSSTPQAFSSAPQRNRYYGPRDWDITCGIQNEKDISDAYAEALDRDAA